MCTYYILQSIYVWCTSICMVYINMYTIPQCAAWVSTLITHMHSRQKNTTGELKETMTAAAVTLDTVADETREKMADGVARSPSRVCSIDGKICCYGDALSTIFLLDCALLPTFHSSFFFFFLLLLFLSLRLCSNLPLSASMYFIVRVLSAGVICTLPHLGVLFFFYSSRFFFFVALISRVTFFLLCSRTRYAST